MADGGDDDDDIVGVVGPDMINRVLDASVETGCDLVSCEVRGWKCGVEAVSEIAGWNVGVWVVCTLTG